MGNLAMILTTEELSRASLAAAGFADHAPGDPHQGAARGRHRGAEEVLAAEDRRGRADGRHLGDRAGHRHRRRRREVPRRSRDRRRRRRLRRERPEVVVHVRGRAPTCSALLARTDPDMSKGAEGPVAVHRREGAAPRPRVRVHAAGRRQAARQGRRDDRLPRHALVHAAASRTGSFRRRTWSAARAALGKGFYLQMGGFAAGRLQTGGRACGLAQAALEKGLRVRARSRAVRPGRSSSTSSRSTMLGRMATKLAAARAITYAAALAMDEDERKAAPLAAQAKLLACDVAVGDHAGRASCCTAAGATPRSTRSAATSSTRWCCRSSRA